MISRAFVAAHDDGVANGAETQPAENRRFDLKFPFGHQRQIGKSYAGRASAAPCLDLFITLLSMGEEGWRRLLADREALVEPFR